MDSGLSPMLFRNEQVVNVRIFSPVMLYLSTF